MASVFDLFGDLKVDTGAFQSSIRAAEERLKSTQAELAKTEKASIKVGDTSATVSRRYEKLNDAIKVQNDRLIASSEAYIKGDISGQKYAQVLASIEKGAAGVSSRVKDAGARVKEIEQTGLTHFQNQIKGATSELGNFANIISGGSFGNIGKHILSIANSFGNLAKEIKASNAAVAASNETVAASAAVEAATVTAANEEMAASNAALAVSNEAVATSAAEAAAAESISLGPIAAAAVLIAGLGIAAYETGSKLFEMAKSASESGKAVGAFETVTGFSARAASALAYNLNFAGKQLSDIQRPMTFFTRQLYDAAHGSEIAQANLARLGVTKFDNIEAAFGQAARKIEDTAGSTEKLGLAASAFGSRGGADMVKAIHRMGGDFDEFQKKAEELGVTLSEDDVQAAKEFAHTYEQVMFQSKLAADKFALAYGPQITKVLEDVSHFLEKNKDTWALWGAKVGIVIDGTYRAIKGLYDFIDAHPAISIALNPVGSIFSQFSAGANDLLTAGAKQKLSNVTAKMGIGGQPDSGDEDQFLDKRNEKLEQINVQEAKQLAAITQKLSLDKETIELGKNKLDNITRIADAEEASLRQQIGLQRQFLADKLAALTPEDKAKGEDAKLQAEADKEVAKLESEIAVNRIKAQKDINAEIEKGIAKVNELGKTWTTAVSALFAKSQSDNPFVALFSAGDQALNALRENLKELSPELQKTFIGIQERINAVGLATTRLQGKFEAIDLRDRAAKFLNINIPRDPTGRLDWLDTRNPAFLGKTTQSVLDQKLAVAAAARTPEEKAAADKAISSLASGLDPEKLNADQRRAIGGALEREAVRKDQAETEARKIQKELIQANKELKAAMDQLKAAVNKGDTSILDKKLEITISDEMTNGKVSNATTATPQDVNLGFASGPGGLTNF